MKLLFIHDHPFYQEDGLVYSGGGLPNTTWNNYLINFDEVYVFGRKSINHKDKKVLSSHDNVSFFLTTNYSSPKTLMLQQKSIEKELKSLIDKVDVVLVRLPSVLGIMAAKYVFQANKKLWVEQVGNAKEALGTQGSLLGRIVAPILEYKNRHVTQKANFVSYVTEHKLQKDYPANLHANTVAISNVIIHNILEKQEVNNERFTDMVFKIGLIGGFDVRYKGQDIFLKALALLDDDIKKQIKISLVGKGDYTWLIELAKKLNLLDNIEYIGPLESGAKINAFLKTLTLYVQPSLTEGMPRASIEAMAMGCPVIGSNVGGIPDIVSECFVHKRGNIVEFSNHIQRLFFDRELLERESMLSLEKARPYLKKNLDEKRQSFYCKMNQVLKNEN